MTSQSQTARFDSFTKIGEAEQAALMTLVGGVRELRRGEHLQRQGVSETGCHLLLDGWAASMVTFRNGSRMILKVHVPGDMLGSPSIAFTESAESIVAMSPVTVAMLPLRAIGRLFEISPRLGAVLYLISQEERVLLIDRLASLGRSSVMGKIAALILQIHARLIRNDPEIGDTFETPLTQVDLADLVGGTDVHINRMLQKLRDENVIKWVRGTVTILDRPRLVHLAELPERELTHDTSWLPPAG